MAASLRWLVVALVTTASFAFAEASGRQNVISLRTKNSLGAGCWVLGDCSLGAETFSATEWKRDTWGEKNQNTGLPVLSFSEVLSNSACVCPSISFHFVMHMCRSGNIKRNCLKRASAYNQHCHKKSMKMHWNKPGIGFIEVDCTYMNTGGLQPIGKESADIIMSIVVIPFCSRDPSTFSETMGFKNNNDSARWQSQSLQEMV